MFTFQRSYGGGDEDAVCRLCSSNSGIMVLNIFDSEGRKRRVLSLIKDCLPVQVSESDPLPKVVCHNCLHKLEVFHEFQRSCVKSEATLRSSVSYSTYPAPRISSQEYDKVPQASQEYVENPPPPALSAFNRVSTEQPGPKTVPDFTAELRPVVPSDQLTHHSPALEQPPVQSVVRNERFDQSKSPLEILVVKQELEDMRNPESIEDTGWDDSNMEEDSVMQDEHVNSKAEQEVDSEEMKTEMYSPVDSSIIRKDLASRSSSSTAKPNLPKPTVLAEHRNPFTMYSEEEFCCRYRLKKQTVMDLLNMIGYKFEPQTNRSVKLTSMDKLFITLNFYATGSFESVAVDNVEVHETKMYQIIKEITEHIASLRPQYIKMPTSKEEIKKVKEQFFRIGDFPGVIGCLGGTHVRIKAPGGDNTELYKNCEGYYSLKVQLVCTADLRFVNIVARWAGSAHNITVFKASRLQTTLDAEECPKGVLLGDSSYMCSRYLLTPLLQMTFTRAEEKYNAAHSITRNTMEKSVALWKKRFPVLSVEMKTPLKTTMAVIVATAVLHNIAIIRRDNLEDSLSLQEADIEASIFDYKEVRSGIINRYFS